MHRLANGGSMSQAADAIRRRRSEQFIIFPSGLAIDTAIAIISSRLARSVAPQFPSPANMTSLPAQAFTRCMAYASPWRKSSIAPFAISCGRWRRIVTRSTRSRSRGRMLSPLTSMVTLSPRANNRSTSAKKISFATSFFIYRKSYREPIAPPPRRDGIPNDKQARR